MRIRALEGIIGSCAERPCGIAAASIAKTGMSHAKENR
jgi:hypothetical protein